MTKEYNYDEIISAIQELGYSKNNNQIMYILYSILKNNRMRQNNKSKVSSIIRGVVENFGNKGI